MNELAAFIEELLRSSTMDNAAEQITEAVTAASLEIGQGPAEYAELVDDLAYRFKLEGQAAAESS